jgi:hypothetical protein
MAPGRAGIFEVRRFLAGVPTVNFYQSPPLRELPFFVTSPNYPATKLVILSAWDPARPTSGIEVSA